MTRSVAKWPTIIKLVSVSTSILVEQLNLYFLTGIMNKSQAESIEEVISIVSSTEIERDKVVLTTLLHQGQIKHLYETFEPRSREWRGQYYSLSKAIVEACQPYL